MTESTMLPSRRRRIRKLFHATTLPLGQWCLKQPITPRDRVLDVFSSKPDTGAIAWVTGPPGVGKTVFALQWAQQFDSDVLYISTRPVDALLEGETHPPDDVGLALEDLLNSGASMQGASLAEELSGHLQHFLQISEGKPRTIILDDLERIDLNVLSGLQEVLAQGLAESHGNRALIISRPLHTTAYEFLHSSRPLITILPSMLNFDRDEVLDAHQRGVFGTATEDQVISAWNASQGWILGILASLPGHGGRTMDEATFHTYILNEYLSVLPRTYLNMMVASAHLPWLHADIWSRWFQQVGLPYSRIGTVLTQMPILADRNDPARFELAPIMRHSLMALGVVAASRKRVNDHLATAVDWFAHNGHADVAGIVARNNHLEDQLVETARQICTDFATREEWSKIRDIVKHLPLSSVVRCPDLAYWYMHALVEVDEWSSVLEIQRQSVPSWTGHQDYTVRGRAMLVRAWADYMFGRADEAITASEESYQLLPNSNHRDRAWAAGSASVAHSLRGNVLDAQHWMSLANFELSHAPTNSRWWHNNIGPLHKSWMASHGLLSESYEASLLALRTQAGSNRVRYLIGLAAIDVERLRFDSARKFLEEAESLMVDSYAIGHHMRVTRANLAMATGDYDLASDILTVGDASGNRRLDQFARESVLRGHIELQAGDVRSAEVFCRAITTGPSRWPKYFGDSHPDLLMALIHHFQGRNSEAIALAQQTLAEARNRTHVRIAVRSNTILAYIFHKLGHVQLRDKAIVDALSDAGTSGFQLALRVYDQDVRELMSAPQALESADSPSLVGQGRSASLLDALTEREIDVLNLVAKSYTNKQIADELFISVSTVKNHLANVFEKLGTKNRRGAVRVAKSLGIVKD